MGQMEKDCGFSLTLEHAQNSLISSVVTLSWLEFFLSSSRSSSVMLVSFRSSSAVLVMIRITPSRHLLWPWAGGLEEGIQEYGCLQISLCVKGGD